jgi:PAS domain S-box-containing protein
MTLPTLQMNNATADDAAVRRRLGILCAKATEGYFEADLRGDLLFFNRAFAKMVTPANSLRVGQSFVALFDTALGKILQEYLDQAMAQGGTEQNFRVRFGRSPDQELHLEMTVGSLADGTSVSGCYGFVRDLTDQQACRSEVQQCSTDLDQADRRSQQRFRTFLDFLPDPLCVFNQDNTVSYLNPAFERVFGWTMAEMAGRFLPFVPTHEKERTREALALLNRETILHGFEGQRLTKDGHLRDVVIGAAVYLDERNRPAGKVVTLRDVTREKRLARTHQILSRMALALHQHQDLKSLLNFITEEIRALIGVEGASVILLDKKRHEFFLPFTAYEDQEAGRRISEVRLPADKGVAGYVYRTGKPLIVPDTSKSDLFLKEPDLQTGYKSQNVLDVPLRNNDRMIGVLMAVNKKEGPFDQEDVDLLMAVAGLVALPLENAHIHHELVRSYDKVNRLNQAKDRVIHHLSHELKTPVAVMKASLHVLKEKLASNPDPAVPSIIGRSERNLNRILEMQYEIGDILGQGNYLHHTLMTALLDACQDELEALSADNPEAGSIHRVLQEKVDALFGPRQIVAQIIPLARFTAERLEKSRPSFGQRRLEIITRYETEAAVEIPEEVLAKVVDGLVRNAVEYTPDGGRIKIRVVDGTHGPELVIRDYGVGMTADKLRLIRDNYFSPGDPLEYSSKHPYEFGAGGKGFDLLRLTIFSERYDFKVAISSIQCGFLADETNSCPGDIAHCVHCRQSEDCHGSGGTTVTISFKVVRQA